MKPVHLTDDQLRSWLEYQEALAAHPSTTPERRTHCEREAEFIRALLLERVENVIRLL